METIESGGRSGPSVIGEVLKSYSDRGFLRGVGAGRRGRGEQVDYSIRWHYNRVVTVRLDPVSCVVSMPKLLPEVPANSAMYANFRKFIHSFASCKSQRPAHRRVDPSKASLTCGNRSGYVSLSLRVLDHDMEYGARKLINVAQEVFVCFLRDGPYYDYRVEYLGLDPDGGWG
jgi:hypothetical protein